MSSSVTATRPMPSSAMPPSYEDSTRAQQPSNTVDGFSKAPEQYAAEGARTTEQTYIQQSSILYQQPFVDQTQQGRDPLSTRKPIAVPATLAKAASPFLRAYPPVLADYGISRQIFLDVIDDINRIMMPNAPVQVVGLAGNIVSMVPHHIFQAIGGGIGLGAGLTNAAISYGRVKMYVKKANLEVFAPKSLVLEICKLEKFAKAAGLPILNADGKIDKYSTLLPDFEDAESLQTQSGQERRLQAMQPWIEELQLSPLPEITPQSNILSKIAVKSSERKRQKGEKEMLKDRREAAKDFHKDSSKAEKEYQKEMAKLDKEESKARRKEGPKKLPRELEKIEKERLKVEKEYNKEMRKCHKDKVKDDKEEKMLRKILWIVVREKKAGEGIEAGTEDLDEDEDEEENSSSPHV